MKQRHINNILVISWGKDGAILKASAHHDEKVAHTKAEEYTEDEDTAHVVTYHARFIPGTQPDTTLIPFDWLELESETESAGEG